MKKGGWCLGFHLSLEQTALHRACLPTPTARYTPGPRATRVPRKAGGKGRERERQRERKREREKRETARCPGSTKRKYSLSARPHTPRLPCSGVSQYHRWSSVADRFDTRLSASLPRRLPPLSPPHPTAPPPKAPSPAPHPPSDRQTSLPFFLGFSRLLLLVLTTTAATVSMLVASSPFDTALSLRTLTSPATSAPCSLSPTPASLLNNHALTPRCLRALQHHTQTSRLLCRAPRKPDELRGGGGYIYIYRERERV